MKILRNTAIIIIMATVWVSTVVAQETENDLETRSSLILSYKLNDEWRLRLIPEIRFDENYDVDKYLIEGDATFKPTDIIALSGKYRFISDVNEKNGTELLSRFALSVAVKEEFNRFKPSFRIQYSNSSDDENLTSEQFLRYKAALEYDVPKTSLTPFIGAELFQQLADNELYKMRYSAGVDYKLFKNNYISLSYKLDYYLQEYRNKHIIDLSYKIKL